MGRLLPESILAIDEEEEGEIDRSEDERIEVERNDGGGGAAAEEDDDDEAAAEVEASDANGVDSGAWEATAEDMPRVRSN